MNYCEATRIGVKVEWLFSYTAFDCNRGLHTCTVRMLSASSTITLCLYYFKRTRAIAPILQFSLSQP